MVTVSESLSSGKSGFGELLLVTLSVQTKSQDGLGNTTSKEWAAMTKTGVEWGGRGVEWGGRGNQLRGNQLRGNQLRGNQLRGNQLR